MIARLCLAAILLPLAVQLSAQDPTTRFEITFPASAHAQPVTGRVYVMISHRGEPEPRRQISQTGGTPFFGRDIEALAPGETAIIDATDLGSPVPNLRDILAGDYYVQAFVNIYSEFRRADGHTVWMHDDQWEGQHWNSSPGNLHSRVQRIRLDPESGYVVQLVADQVIPPVELPSDTPWVKSFRFESPLLTEFWGRPVYLGATVLLPRDYDRETIDYPVIYQQGHFSLAPPMGFREGSPIYREWMRDNFPRMIVVTFQHPNPYYDDSYAVDSVNVGPYGEAIMEELIPEVEQRFRIIRQPYARSLTGGSTGGWERHASHRGLCAQLLRPHASEDAHRRPLDRYALPGRSTLEPLPRARLERIRRTGNRSGQELPETAEITAHPLSGAARSAPRGSLRTFGALRC